MKKYLLFVTTHEMGSGGWDDFVGDFDSIEEAKVVAKARQKEMRGYADVTQIINRDTKEVEK